MDQGSMNSGQGAAARVGIFDDTPVTGKLSGVADDGDITNRTHDGDCSLKEGAAAEVQEGLVGAHARALASRQDEAHTRRYSGYFCAIHSGQEPAASRRAPPQNCRMSFGQLQIREMQQAASLRRCLS